MAINKKGDISTLVLVIGVFLVCAVAIFSFAVFNISSQQKFLALQKMASVNSIAEQARFYENAGIKPEDYLDIKKGNGFYNITVEWKDDDKRLFYAEYIIPIKMKVPSPSQ